MKNFNHIALSAAICLALSTSAMATSTSEAEYKAAKIVASANQKADEATCQSMAGNAKEICIVDANGREKVALAQLEANYQPSAEHEYDVRVANADATYASAKQRCDDAAGNVKEVCRKEAQGAFVSAKADAQLASKTENASKNADAAKRDAAYSTAKEKCKALANEAKATCIKDAKTLYGQI